MLKQLTAAILLLAFIASTFCRTVIVLDYYANTTAYAKACINKARRALHCNGKCQLMKKLDQQEKNDQDNLETKSENKNEIQPGAFCRMLFPEPQITLHAAAHTICQKPVDRYYPLLRPPSAV